MAFYMDDVTYVNVNGPVAIISLFTTIFLCSCLLCSKSSQEEGLKQPLSLLLWSVVGWNGFVQLITLMNVFVEVLETSMELEFWVARLFMVQFSINSSLSTSAWQSIFYFCQIVPAQHPLFVWMKRDMKRIIYWGLAIDRGILLFDIVIKSLYFNAIKRQLDEWANGQNGNFSSANYSEVWELDTNSVMFYIAYSNFFFQMFVLLLHILAAMSSSCSTVLYLQKHMKRMQMSLNSSFSSPRLQSQWRVTITGIIQAGLYLFCSLWIILSNLFDIFQHNFDSNYHIISTVICLFSFGSTIMLGIGQTLFRQQAADLWSTAVQIFQFCRFNRE